jgi:hypothetical protein
MPPAWVLEQQACEVSSSQEKSKTNQYGASCDDATTKTDAMTEESSHSSPPLDSTSTHSLGTRSIDSCWPEREDTKVKFDVENLTKIHWVPPRSELCAEQFKDVWMDASDYNRISSWNRMTVKMIRQRGTLDDEPEHCSRGLEHRLQGQQRLRQMVKTNAIYGVLHEQSRQRESGSNAQRIADIYRGYVFGSDEAAKQKGIQDEKAAKEFVARPSRQARRLSHALATTFRPFDEDDLKDLRALMNGGEDEVDASEALRPQKIVDVFEEKVTKASKVKRLTRFFKKKSSKHGKSEPSSRTRSPSPPPPTRRLRRSSM